MTVLVSLLSACSEKEPARSQGNGLVRMEFRLPKTYSTGEVMTKTDVLSDPRDITVLDPDISLTSLPDGSTLWMMISEKNDDGTYGEPQLKAYVVRNDVGFHSLFACAVESVDGGYRIGEETSAPLLLENGRTYRFNMVSPAYDMNADLSIPLRNGMYIYSTDGRYEQTQPKDITVTANASNDGTGVQYVLLNPMVQQVARMNFTIVRGRNVNSLEVLPAGIEISGLQNPYDSENGSQTTFRWSSMDIADTLVVRRGDKRSWVSVPGEDVRLDENDITCTWTAPEHADKTVTYTESIRADIGVLPTNAQSTTIIITFNLLVNGIPTQYVTTLNQGVTVPEGEPYFSNIIEQGHSYDMILEVSQNDGIFVFNWQYQSWTADMELTKTE